jgi:hypothetical protein
MTEGHGKHNFQVEDWSKIRYMVKCNWGVLVNHEYPKPQIVTKYFETLQGITEFIEDYKASGSISKDIYFAVETLGEWIDSEHTMNTAVKPLTY